MAQLDISGVLTKATSLSAEQIKSVLANPAVSQARSVGETLSKKDYSSADDLVADLCRELGLEFIKDIPVNDISADLIRDLPINYAKTQGILPYRADGDTLIALTSNPLNTKALDDLRILFNKRIRPLVSTSQRVQDAINRVYEKSTTNMSGMDEIEEDEMDLEDPIIDLLEAGEDDAPVIKLVNSLLFRAVKEKASDIHIEPYEKDMVVRYRIDGILFDIFKPPKKLQNAITSRIKVMANLNIAEKRLPQDGRFKVRVGDVDLDLRVSFLPTQYGESVVMRLLSSSKLYSMTELGLSKQDTDLLDGLIKKPHGIIFVTGPTGSGKTTTLYSCLSRVNNVDRKIITIENPIEYQLKGVKPMRGLIWICVAPFN